MHKNIQAYQTKLAELEDALRKVPNAELMANHGGQWNIPPISFNQMAETINYYSGLLSQESPGDITPEESKYLSESTASIESFIQLSLPNLHNVGHFPQGLYVYLTLIENIRTVVGRVCGWVEVRDSGKLPAKIARKLKGLHSRVDKQIDVEVSLADKIKMISDANDAAEQLPTTIEELEQAQQNLKDAIETGKQSVGKVEEMEGNAIQIINTMKLLDEEAKKLVEQCGDAHRAVTSQGLAASFDAQAVKLNRSTNLWVLGLVISLVAGGAIGYQRFSQLTQLFSTISPDKMELAWIEILFSALSLILPLWFAWLATKQIGQRFRLSQDYAFKASLAKAYEGFRREAVKFDKETEAKLFNTALSRLDEEPLRFVEKTVHGSPLQETGITETVQSVSEDLKDTAIGAVKAAADKIPIATKPQ